MTTPSELTATRAGRQVAATYANYPEAQRAVTASQTPGSQSSR
ncbi:MAG TPA: hypothetical protein VF752_05775 [Thermoleophilaceae bacterium]